MTDHAKLREQAEQEIEGMRGTVLERLIPGSRPAEILALLDEIDRLNAEWMAKCEELRKDAERLDFVMTYAAITHWSKDHEYCWLVRETEDDGQYNTERMVRGCFSSAREAIDAAMAKKEGA